MNDAPDMAGGFRQLAGIDGLDGLPGFTVDAPAEMLLVPWPKFISNTPAGMKVILKARLAHAYNFVIFCQFIVNIGVATVSPDL